MKGIVFAIAAMFACCSVHADDTPPVPKAGIGYPDVPSALVAVQSHPDLERGAHGEYVVMESPERLAIWSFAPFAHPAYPAAVKHTIYLQDGELKLETRSMCQASAAACEAMLVEVGETTANLRDRIAQFIREDAARLKTIEAERARRERRNRAAQHMIYPRH